MAGQLQKIWLKTAHDEPLVAKEQVEVTEGKGIVGDLQFAQRRQVTIIETERWQRAEKELGSSVDPGARRANLLVSGVNLTDSAGRELQIGDIRILIRGETQPCSLMDEMHQGLREALTPDWGGGAWGDVVAGGSLAVGDAVSWKDD